MLQNAYFLAKIGAGTSETEQHFAEILPIGRRVADATADRRVRKAVAARQPAPPCRWTRISSVGPLHSAPIKPGLRTGLSSFDSHPVRTKNVLPLFFGATL